GAPLELRRVEIENGLRGGAIWPCLGIAEIERQFCTHGTWTRSQRIEPRGKRWRERCNQRCKLSQRRRSQIKRQLSGRTGAIEIAAALQHDAIRLTDLHPVEQESLRTVGQFYRERMQFLASRDGAADIERQLRFLRPLGLRARQRANEGRVGIEIEPFRL